MEKKLNLQLAKSIHGKEVLSEESGITYRFETEIAKINNKETLYKLTVHTSYTESFENNESINNEEWFHLLENLE